MPTSWPYLHTNTIHCTKGAKALHLADKHPAGEKLTFKIYLSIEAAKENWGIFWPSPPIRYTILSSSKDGPTQTMWQFSSQVVQNWQHHMRYSQKGFCLTLPLRRWAYPLYLYSSPLNQQRNENHLLRTNKRYTQSQQHNCIYCSSWADDEHVILVYPRCLSSLPQIAASVRLFAARSRSFVSMGDDRRTLTRTHNQW